MTLDLSLAAVRAALAGTSVEAAATKDGRIVIADGPPMAVAWAGSGLPRDVTRCIDTFDAREPAILTAKRLTPNSVQMLTERGLNFADLSGHARIILPGRGVVIVRDEPHPRPSQTIATAAEQDVALPITARGGHSWPPAALAVAEWILVERRVGGIDEMADALRLSHGRVSQILATFDALALTTRTGGRRGRSVVREAVRDKILIPWGHACAQRDRPTLHAHTTERHPLRIAQSLKPGLDEIGDWAVTGWVAASLLAPFVTQVPTLQLYLPAESVRAMNSAALRRLNLTKVDEPARVTIWAADGYALQSASQPSVASIPLCHPVRVYSDLLRIGGRAHDAADHLRTELLA